MLREIIKPMSEFYNIHIPKEYINREVEILVLPFSYDKKAEIEDNQSDDIFLKTFGILKSKNIDPLKWQEEIRSDREI
ncbi:MAG: hypothetical protein J0647_02490 [Campylobacteraceae bacterium]|nr:hypothetical protein [Campylobacteraceae bacterium]